MPAYNSITVLYKEKKVWFYIASFYKKKIRWGLNFLFETMISILGKGISCGICQDEKKINQYSE